MKTKKVGSASSNWIAVFHTLDHSSTVPKSSLKFMQVQVQLINSKVCLTLIRLETEETLIFHNIIGKTHQILILKKFTLSRKISTLTELDIKAM